MPGIATRSPDQQTIGVVPPDDNGDMGSVDERADLLADILGGLLGDDAVSLLFQDEDAKRWESHEHPRIQAGEPNAGRFQSISSDRVDAAHQKIDSIRTSQLKPAAGSVSAAAAQDLHDHLSTLTIKQLHEVKKHHGLKASAGTKAELVAKIKQRLVAKLEAMPHGVARPPGVVTPLPTVPPAFAPGAPNPFVRPPVGLGVISPPPAPATVPAVRPPTPVTFVEPDAKPASAIGVLNAPATPAKPKLDLAQPPVDVATRSLSGKEHMDRFFGKPIPDHVAKAIGMAAPDSTVTISKGYGDSIRVHSQGPGDYKATRTITRHPNGKIECHNDIFVHDKDKVKTAGVDIFCNQVRGLKAAGVNYVTTFAAGSVNDSYFNGYYTWPRFGYQSKIDDCQFSRLPKEIKTGMGARGSRSGSGNFVGGSREIADVFKQPGGDAAWKQHGSGLQHCEFDLTDGSKSMKECAAYAETRMAAGTSKLKKPIGVIATKEASVPDIDPYTDPKFIRLQEVLALCRTTPMNTPERDALNAGADRLVRETGYAEGVNMPDPDTE